MKIMIRSLAGLAFSGAMLCAVNTGMAQTDGTTTTITTTSDGTITKMTGDGMVIKSMTSADPITYSSTKTTTYVDENGKPVAIETVKSGMPVTVYYGRDGNRMVATKVIVRKTTIVDPAPLTSATPGMTASEGFITRFSPDTMVIRSATATEPVTYVSTRTTLYVDENGNPISFETIKTGMPVTIYYDTDGSKMVATRVVLRK